MNTTQNPTALRSKEWLTSALFDLMKTKAFHDISITEITTKADLSRRTFYRLFSSKEEIILSYLDTIWEMSTTELENQADHSYYHSVYWYLCFWYEHRDLALLLYKHDLYSLLQKFYNQKFSDIYLKLKPTFPLSKNPEALDYSLAYCSGGLLNILWKWAKEGMLKTPDEFMSLLMLAYQTPGTFTDQNFYTNQEA